jgi:hypothetical protein
MILASFSLSHRRTGVPANSLHPYHPIIYVRGFAATQDEIEETVADPYMGFNIGSTKSRTVWSGETRRFFFESPLVRLMRDHKYSDVFEDGEDEVNIDRPDRPPPYRSIVIYRYYDEASKDFGDGGAPPIEHFARGLGRLILRLRDKVCAHPKNGVAPDDFRVYLVAHSMGGLVCRAFLQNPELGSAEARPWRRGDGPRAWRASLKSTPHPESEIGPMITFRYGNAIHVKQTPAPEVSIISPVASASPAGNV